MKSRLAVFAALVAALGLSIQSAKAIPALQLDIVGGVYSNTPLESIVIDADEFELVALLSPGGNAPASNGVFTVAVSLVPATTTPGLDLGSFIFEGITVNANADMSIGSLPPNFPSSGFPNSFWVYDFTFDLVNGKVLAYNSMDNPGGPTPDANGTMFAALFDVDKSNLADGVELRFDLFFKDANGNVSQGQFAPLSHNAETIPEPTGFVLTLAGLALFGMIRRRSK